MVIIKHVIIWFIADINFMFIRDHWDHVILCSSLANSNFVMLIINHIIICGSIADINSIFNHGRWDYVM